MEYVFAFMIFSAIAFLIGRFMFPHTITWKELAAGAVIQLAGVCLIYYGSIYSKGHDTQILNGSVVSKQQERVSCEHSYSCNCRTTCSRSGKSTSCSRTCDTCYEHNFDFDWVVDSDVGHATIDRVDRQGTQTPPRWSAVKIGEPFAKEDSYFNYIKASPLTIFDKTQLNAATPVPGYIGVHDYYRVNRVINFGSRYSGDFSELNTLLNESLKKLGPKKKVNVLVIFHGKGDNFAEVVKAKHLGGKINDVYVLIDAAADGTIEHASAFSWSKSDLVNIKIRDEILDLGKVDMKGVANVVDRNIDTLYNHRSIEEFEYLENNIVLSDWALYLIIFFGIGFPLIWCYVAHKHID